MANATPKDLIAVHSGRGVELIVELLRASINSERLAQGPTRRVAFRTTRHLLGGALSLGLGRADIARQLAMSQESIRSRGAGDGIIRAATFAELASLTPEHIDGWYEAGWIEILGPDGGGTIGYRASDLLVALVRQQSNDIATVHLSRADSRAGPAHLWEGQA